MENEISLKSLIHGFLAGIIATLTVHELATLALAHAGATGRIPWSLAPTLMTGLPQIASDALWGGVWGAIFAVILGAVPKGSMTLRGAVLGILLPGVIGILLLTPFLKGEPLFFSGDPNAIASSLVIEAAFGAAAAWVYGFFSAGLRLPGEPVLT